MDMNFLVTLIVLLLVVGMLCWCVMRIPGLPAPIPIVIQVLIVLCFAVYILNHVGTFGGTGHISGPCG
jgi:biotin transporter BioY